MPKQSLDSLIKEGKVHIFAEKNTQEYIKALLCKFEKNFGLSFEGSIDVHFYYPKHSPSISFIIDMAPSNPSSYIQSVNNKEDSEKSLIYSSMDCVQIRISDLLYQIRYFHSN